MDPLCVAARHAAFVWYTNRPENAGTSRSEAMKFSSENCVAFLPLAHEGWGRLLIRIASGREKRRGPRRARAAAND